MMGLTFHSRGDLRILSCQLQQLQLGVISNYLGNFELPGVNLLNSIRSHLRLVWRKQHSIRSHLQLVCGNNMLGKKHMEENLLEF